MKKTKKIALILMTVVLMTVCFVFGASAERAIVDSGECGAQGDNVTWVLYDDGELVIGGEGSMKDYGYKNDFGGTSSSPRPWMNLLVEKVTIQDRVTHIGFKAFADCENLESITIPDSVTHIGSEAFADCRSLESITIPDSVTSIGDDAFSQCASLKSIHIGSGVDYIGTRAFYGTEALEFITVSKDNETFCADSFGVLYNGKENELISFPVASKITHYVIPDETVYIHTYAFRNAYNLIEVSIPDNIYIDEFAFMKCIRLENILFPDSATDINIGCGAFMHCISLDNVLIPSGTTVGDNAFGDCGIRTIYIDDKVELSGYVIVANFFLEKVYIKGMKNELGSYAICASEDYIEGLNREQWIEYSICVNSGADDAEKYEALLNDSYRAAEGIVFIGTIYCHSGSTAEAYAIENGVDYVLTHFFEGDWIYDYDNMIRYRKCIHCDELETEKLESTNNGDVEIIEPSDPDTDFEVEEIEGDNFIVVKEIVTNGIEGNAEVLRAFDITLKNKDGVHVQPDGTVKVKLPLDWTKDGIYKVYRVNDDGSLTNMNAYRQGSHMVFETDHFSVYVIVDTSEKTEPEKPETPDVPDTSDCNCICHKEGFIYEILAIVFRFVAKILGVFPTCDCGIAHY